MCFVLQKKIYSNENNKIIQHASRRIILQSCILGSNNPAKNYCNIAKMHCNPAEFANLAENCCKPRQKKKCKLEIIDSLRMVTVFDRFCFFFVKLYGAAHKMILGRKNKPNNLLFRYILFRYFYYFQPIYV